MKIKRQQEKTDISEKINFAIAVIVLMAFLLVLIGFDQVVSKWGSFMFISSTQETTVFQTGPLRPLDAVIGMLWALFMFSIFVIIILSLLSKIKNWKYRRQSHVNGDIKYCAIVLIALVLVSGIGAFFVMWIFEDDHITPSSEKVFINESEQVIKIERDYLFRSEENLKILFDEIDHITYHYYKSTSDLPSFASVEVTKIDGTKIEIYKGNELKTQRNLAKVIAKATGKELVNQDHKAKTIGAYPMLD